MFPSSDWRAISIRAVAARAGVSERTVYRNFATERVLRATVLRQLHEEAGVELDDLRLEDFAAQISRMIRHMALTFSAPSSPQDPDPGVAAAYQQKREALVAAVEAAAPRWSPTDRQLAAAMLDLVGSVLAFQELTVEWELDSEDVARGVAWVIRLIEAAVRADEPPPSETPGS